MLKDDKVINNSNSIQNTSINPTYLKARRNLLQTIKSLNNKQYFSSRTYFTAILYMDYYFYINNTNPSYKYSDLLLIALCALILSAKYFEIDSHIPDIKKFIYMITHITKHHYTFTLNDVLQGEVLLLKCLQYRLQYHSLYSYTIFYFCHGIIFDNDPFLTAQNLNASSNEIALNKFLEKVYINARELMDYIVHQSNYVCLGNDCHLIAVAILVKVLSVIKGTNIIEPCGLFRIVYNVDVSNLQFNNILHMVEEQYMKMQIMKENIKKRNFDNESNVLYLKGETLPNKAKRNENNKCNESMLKLIVPELRESHQWEGGKIFMKLLEEDVLFFNKEDEEIFTKHKRSLSVSCESSTLAKIVFSENNSNMQENEHHKETFHLSTNTINKFNSNHNNRDTRSTLNSTTNENSRKGGKSFTYCYDMNEFKHHITKYKKKVYQGNKRNESNKYVNVNENENFNYDIKHNTTTKQNSSVNMRKYLSTNKGNYNCNNNNLDYNNYNNYLGNFHNNNNSLSTNEQYLNYYQQLKHNTIIINNNIHINNYPNNNNNNSNNNNNYPLSNYVNMNLPMMNNNNNYNNNNNSNQMMYFNNQIPYHNQNNNYQFQPFPQQQPNCYPCNNYYNQYNPIQMNINVNYKVNPYSINRNSNPNNNNYNYNYNYNSYNNPNYFYNKHF